MLENHQKKVFCNYFAVVIRTCCYAEVECLSTKSHAQVFCKKVSQTLHMRHLLFIFKQCGESDHSPIIIWKAKLPIAGRQLHLGKLILSRQIKAKNFVNENWVILHQHFGTKAKINLNITVESYKSSTLCHFRCGQCLFTFLLIATV